MTTTSAFLCCILLTGACGTKRENASGGGSCARLAVTVDGTVHPALPHGLARISKMTNSSTIEVEMFNHDKATCDEMTSKKGRNIHDGEISVRAFTGGSGMMGTGVGIEAHTQAGGNVRLVGDKPTAVGDIVKICVDNASFVPAIGSFKNKQVTVTGLFEGKYCGELVW